MEESGGEIKPSVTQKIESDHNPDVVSQGKGIKRLERTGIKDQLATPEARRNLFGSMSDEQYKKMLGYVNSITRKEKIDYEYKDGQLPMDSTPPMEDKERLMNMTYQTVREILNDDNRDNLNSLRRAALTLAGAVNYIHPYENGNGRTGRVAHYLMEYGLDRGGEAFDQDLYSIIGKLPLYDVDMSLALSDSPPSDLSFELNKYIIEHTELKDFSTREFASKKVEVFLEMMSGKINLPINREVSQKNIANLRKGDMVKVETISPGSLNGVELYEKEYLFHSTIPNRAPNDIPPGAKRVVGERKDDNIPKIIIPFDLV